MYSQENVPFFPIYLSAMNTYGAGSKHSANSRHYYYLVSKSTMYRKYICFISL